MENINGVGFIQSGKLTPDVPYKLSVSCNDGSWKTIGDVLSISFDHYGEEKKSIGGWILSKPENEIKSVFYNPPYTTILWADGSKSTSCAMETDEFDEYVGFYSAVTNHFIENKSEQKRLIKDAWKNFWNREENKLKKLNKKENKKDKK